PPLHARGPQRERHPPRRGLPLRRTSVEAGGGWGGDAGGIYANARSARCAEGRPGVASVRPPRAGPAPGTRARLPSHPPRRSSPPRFMTDTEPLALSHVDDEGRARMVDVSTRAASARTAVARGRVLIGADAFRLVRENRLRKGDVLTVAQVAGILGAKQTSRLLPLCHDVVLEGVDLDLELNEADFAIDVRAYVKTTGPTGVE